MFLYKFKKHVFMFFYLHINVFNIYGLRVNTARAVSCSCRTTTADVCIMLLDIYVITGHEEVKM